jgi:hypothetical protein
MRITGRRRLVRLALRAGILLAAAVSVGAMLTGSAGFASPHHAVADNGVINSRNLSPRSAGAAPW